MNLVVSLKYFLVYFRLFGISLYSPNMTKTMRRFVIFFASINFIYITFTPLLLILNSSRKFKLSDRSFLYIILYYGVFFIHAVTILETLTTKKNQLHFWNTLEKIEETFAKDKNCLKKKNFNLKRKLIYCFSVLLFVSMTCKIGLWISNRLFKIRGDWFMIDTSSFISQECSRLNYFSQYFFIEILRLHVTFYNEKIREVAKMAKKYTESMLFSELNLLNVRHSLIWELNSHVNSFFKWRQIFNFLHSFLNITNLLFWIYHGSNIGKLDYKMIVNLIQYIITLVHLIYSCEMLKEEALRSPALIQEVSQQVAYAPNHELYNSVMIISMQIHHEKISINYGGFFRVDMSLLTTMAATTTTYLVMFIQFFD
uniref:Gustatory receptor n=1 Tax=Phlebotomus papatasi TaxID=29031 RepID=A0A3F2ZEF1_PHLPP